MKHSLKRLRSTCLLLVGLAVGVAACKNDSDPSPGSGSGVEGNWTISAIRVNPAIDGVSDYLQLVNLLLGNDCLTRITFSFRKDGSMGATVPQECKSAEEAARDFGVSQTSKWKVEGSKIILTEGTTVTDYDLEVNATTMGWSYNEVDPNNGQNNRWTLEFKRK
jgi:hypothetical protein